MVELLKEKPELDLIPTRVKEVVKQGENAQVQAYKLFSETVSAFAQATNRNLEMRSEIRNSELWNLFGKPRPTLFNNAMVRFGRNRDEQTYTVSALIDGQTHIVTLRIGNNFTELSLAQTDGTLIEVLREENGSVRFWKP